MPQNFSTTVHTLSSPLQGKRNVAIATALLGVIASLLLIPAGSAHATETLLYDPNVSINDGGFFTADDDGSPSRSGYGNLFMFDSETTINLIRWGQGKSGSDLSQYAGESFRVLIYASDSGGTQGSLLYNGDLKAINSDLIPCIDSGTPYPTNPTSCILDTPNSGEPTYGSYYAIPETFTFEASEYYLVMLKYEGSVTSPSATYLQQFFKSSYSPSAPIRATAFAINADDSVTPAPGSRLTLMQLWYDDTIVEPPPDDTTTRIITVEPADDEIVATSTPTTWGMTGYLNINQFKTGARARLKLDRNTDNQAVGALIAWEAATGNDTYFPLASDGSIDVSTTTVEHLLGVEREGLWHMRWEIQAPRFTILGQNFFYETLAATSTSYTYGQPTGIDIVQETQEDILEGIWNATTDPLENCQFDITSVLDFSAEDNIYTCIVTMVSSMIIPNGQQAQLLIEGAKESFLDKAPWGYATRVYEILSTDTSTTTLPSIAFTIPDGLPGDSHASIDFSPWAPIGSAIERIDTTEVETIDGSPLDMFLHWWNILWLIMFALWVIRELHGAWEAGDFEHDGHSSSSMDKGIYAYRGLVQTRNKMDRESLRQTQRDIIRRSRR